MINSGNESSHILMCKYIGLNLCLRVPRSRKSHPLTPSSFLLCRLYVIPHDTGSPSTWCQGFSLGRCGSWFPLPNQASLYPAVQYGLRLNFVITAPPLASLKPMSKVLKSVNSIGLGCTIFVAVNGTRKLQFLNSAITKDIYSHCITYMYTIYCPSNHGYMVVFLYRSLC